MFDLTGARFMHALLKWKTAEAADVAARGVAAVTRSMLADKSWH